MILDRVTIQDCGSVAATGTFAGAAISAKGPLRINNSRFLRNGRANQDNDSTIEFKGFSLQIVASQFHRNSSPIVMKLSDGAFQSMFNSVQIDDSVFTENRGSILLASNPSNMNINRSTFLRNRGFVFMLIDGGEIEILNSVIASNEFFESSFMSSAGVASFNISLGNSIFIRNVFPPQTPREVFFSLGHNLIQDRPDWGTFADATDIISDDVNLVAPEIPANPQFDLDALYPLVLSKTTVLKGNPLLCRLARKRTPVTTWSPLGGRCVPGAL